MNATRSSRILLAAIATVTMNAALPAFAADADARPAPGKRLDADGDGRISRDEAARRPHLAQRFDAIDANKDGYLSREEMKAFAAKQRGAHFKAFDTDGDGRISRQEATKRPRLAEHFDAIDTNKDGYLSKEELQAARQAHGKR